VAEPSPGARRPWPALLAAALTLLLLALAAGWLMIAHSSRPLPSPLPVGVSGSVPPDPLRAGDTLRLLSWNIQYAASRKHHFFYDGGPTTRVPEDDVRETLAALSDALVQQQPDLLLLQEVDRGSARTAHIDQLPGLVDASGARRWASTTYHRSFFVPHPLPRALGRVDMHLAMGSRHELRLAERIQLPLLDEGRLRRAFNLKRAVLWAEIPVEGMALPLAVAVTHLSAFSRGDGTMEEQVAVLEDWMSRREATGQPWILAGDLNLLPPGDDPGRLADGAESYADAANPIQRLVPRFRTITAVERLLAPEQRSYLPFGAAEPDRKIDWIFVGGDVEVLQAQVLREYSELSDHLPLLAQLRIGTAAAESP